jgi:hypothetical protein
MSSITCHVKIGKTRWLGPCRCFIVFRMKLHSIVGPIFRAKRSSLFYRQGLNTTPRVVRHNAETFAKRSFLPNLCVRLNIVHEVKL